MIFNCCGTTGGGGRVNSKDVWVEVCPWLQTDKIITLVTLFSTKDLIHVVSYRN